LKFHDKIEAHGLLFDEFMVSIVPIEETMSAPPGASPQPSPPDPATLRAGILVSIAAGIFQYLNSWIRLALIPGDVEYHVRQLQFQHVVHVTLLNSLLTALLLSAVWILGVRLRNSRLAETLHFFVLSVLAIA